MGISDMDAVQACVLGGARVSGAFVSAGLRTENRPTLSLPPCAACSDAALCELEAGMGRVQEAEEAARSNAERKHEEVSQDTVFGVEYWLLGGMYRCRERHCSGTGPAITRCACS